MYLFKVQPFYHNNPAIHSQVVTSYERIAENQKAFKSRDKITNLYVKDGPWYAFNHRNQEAIDQARGLMKDALLQSGEYHYEMAKGFTSQAEQSALVSDKEALLKKASKEYDQASLAYQRYLNRYNQDENTYTLMVRYADALFFSNHYAKALDQYLKVRDSKLGDEYKNF